MDERSLDKQLLTIGEVRGIRPEDLGMRKRGEDLEAGGSGERA